jgi:hypothetical protein
MVAMYALVFTYYFQIFGGEVFENRQDNCYGHQQKGETEHTATKNRRKEL